MWNKLTVLACTLPLLLAACGGSDPTPSPPPDTQTTSLFTPANAYTGDVSAARMVTPAEFERQIQAGEVELDTPEKRQARFEAAQKKIKADLEQLQAIPDDQKSPDVKALLSSKVDLPTMPDGNYVLPVKQNDGSSVNVVTLGTPAMAAIITDSLKRSGNPDNQLDVYRLGYDGAPEEARANLPAPDSLRGKGLAELLEARDLLNAALEKVQDLDGVKEAALSSTLTPQAVLTDVGDQGTDCPRSEAGVYRNFAWPLKNFQNNVKQQGMRGTCWAFAAVAALESRDRVVYDSPVDLSEQFLVNKVKREWGASDYGDNGGAEYALWRAADNNFLIPREQYWPYNPAYGRPANAFQNDDPKTPQNEQVAGTLASYKGACGPANVGGNTLVYTWSCSESAHQSPLICAAADSKNFCGYYRMVAPAGATGAAPDRTSEVWNNQWSTLSASQRRAKFPLAELRNHLAAGRVLISSFGVFTGFDNPVNGFVTNFSDAGARGGHVTVIVGYVGNAALHRRLPAAPSDPNGFFILKNSWGCSGDGGYYYVPVDYVTRFFSNLSVLTMTNQRGQNWQRERTNPGGLEAARIGIKVSPAQVDLRVETDLAGFFTVSQPNVKSVNLNVSSNVDGPLYSGGWSTDTGALFGSSLKYAFKTPGPRTLLLVASNNGIDTRATFDVNVVNTPPALSIQTSGDAHQGDDYLLTATLKDVNEPDLGPLCARMVWSVEAPDAVSSQNGCTVRVKLGAQGARTVKASTTDQDGAAGAGQVTLSVLPPPANPYPKLGTSGVYSREFVGGGPGTLRFCGSPAVASGNTIDLTQKGCTFSISQPQPTRYFAEVKVENPGNEALSYDWQLNVSNRFGDSTVYSDPGSKTPSFELYSPGNATLVTNDCRVSVKVNAPDPARSKGPITVWAGKCTYYASRLN